MIKKLRAKLLKSEFLRHVLTLMTGSGIAVLIPIIASPVITRLFSPQDFGILALFTTIICIGSTLVTLRYEPIIMLAKNNKDALNVSVLTLSLSFIITILGFLIVLILGKEYVFHYFSAETLEPYFYIIGITIFLSASIQILNYSLNRKKEYKKLATTKIIGTVASTGSKLLCGWQMLGAFGLIISNTIGFVFTFIQLSYHFLKNTFRLKDIDIKNMVALAVKYKKFPIFNIPSDLINVLAINLHIILFLKFYGAEIVGIISFATIMINVPLSIISQSFSQVYYQRISEIEDKEILFTLYKKSFFIVLGAFFVLIISALFIPSDLFAFIFGEKWRVLGNYIFPISIWLGLQFMSLSLSTIYVKLEKLSLLFIFNITNIISIFIAIYTCFIYKINIYNTLFVFAFSSGILYLCLAILGFYIIKKERK